PGARGRAHRRRVRAAVLPAGRRGRDRGGSAGAGAGGGGGPAWRQPERARTTPTGGGPPDRCPSRVVVLRRGGARRGVDRSLRCRCRLAGHWGPATAGPGPPGGAGLAGLDSGRGTVDGGGGGTAGGGGTWRGRAAAG